MVGGASDLAAVSKVTYEHEDGKLLSRVDRDRHDKAHVKQCSCIGGRQVG
jgi:hypothetical protein